MLIFVPGVGCGLRTQNVADSLRTVLQTKQSLQISCAVGMFVRREVLLEETDALGLPAAENAVSYIESVCRLQHIYAAHYADFVKTLNPLLVSESGYSYVVLLLDDVQLPKSFHFSRFIHHGHRFGLDIFSPSVQGAWQPTTQFDSQYSLHHGNMLARPHLVEVFLTAHSVQGWSCYWACTDPVQLSKGWGADLMVYNYCKEQAPDFRMGVFHDMVVIHNLSMICNQIPSDQLSRSFSNREQFEKWKEFDASGMVQYLLNGTL